MVWSEWGDSNSRHLAPKASALPTALHPVMKFFQMWSNMWSTPIFDQLPSRGIVLSAQLPQGFPGVLRTEARTCAPRSQIQRADGTGQTPFPPFYFTEISCKVKGRLLDRTKPPPLPLPGPRRALSPGPAVKQPSQITALRRQTLTPAAAMANTNQKIHITLG